MLTLAVVAILQAIQQRQHLLRLEQHGRQRRHGQLAMSPCPSDGHAGLAVGFPMQPTSLLRLRGGELFTLTSAGPASICVLISANNFLVIYLA